MLEEKESFLENSKLIDCGDKYIDGHDAAKALGIEFEKDTGGFGNVSVNKTYKKLSK